MEHRDRNSPPRRSPAGLAVALALATATMWVGGLVVELRPQLVATAKSAIAAQGAACSDAAHDATSCGRNAAPPRR